MLLLVLLLVLLVLVLVLVLFVSLRLQVVVVVDSLVTAIIVLVVRVSDAACLIPLVSTSYLIGCGTLSKSPTTLSKSANKLLSRYTSSSLEVHLPSLASVVLISTNVCLANTLGSLVDLLKGIIQS